MRANSGKKSGPREYLAKFVAQINLADMKDLQDYLPKSGFLYFFIDSQYYASRCMNYPYHIFYYAGDADSLQSAKDLPIDMVDIFDIDQGFETEGGAKPAKATARAVISILHNTYPEEYEAEDAEDEDSDPYQYNTNLSFDYPSPIIDAPESLLERFAVNENAMNAQFSYEGNYDGSPYVRAAQLFGGHPGDYIMLLQTAGNPDINHFMYEDGDAMYFMIAKDKLKNLDFSEVYVGNTWWWRDGPGEEPQYWDKKLLKKQIKECLK